MNLMDLPEEVIRMIIQYLDIKSIQNLYDTCSNFIRAIILNHNVVKKVKISLSSAATVKFFKTRFFKDIAPFVQELDMSTVPDLSKITFLSTIKKLRTLKMLNVSYTSIKIEYFADLNDSCLDLKTLCTNIEMCKKINSEILSKLQNFFQRLDNVHFVVSSNSPIYSNVVFHLLQKCKLNSLKITATHHNMVSKILANNLAHEVRDFNHFYFLLGCLHHCHYPDLSRIPVLTVLDLNLFEFIIICSTKLDSHQVFISQLFLNFFDRYFDLEPCYVTNLDGVKFYGNIAVMLWKKDTTTFDDTFFQSLLSHLKEFFPYCIKTGELTAPRAYDWFIVTPMIAADDETNYEPNIKSKRIGVKKTNLDYDTLFSDKEKIEISFNFNYIFRGAVTLSSNSNYLSKITYLSLCGVVRYSPEFFRVLFECCNKMNTLNVEAHSLSPCSQTICRYLPLCTSLRNFRLVDVGINFMDMFTALSACRLIENVFIREDSNIKPSNFADPSALVQNCINLYHISLDFPTSATLYKTQWRPMLNRIRSKGHSSLNLVLLPRTSGENVDSFYEYNPFLKVFKLNAIRDI